MSAHLRMLALWSSVMVAMAVAQGPSSSDSSNESAPSQSPQRQRFDQLYEQFKDLLSQLRQLQLRYKEVLPAQRAEIEEQFQQKRRQAHEVLENLQAEAQRQFAADPSQEDIGRFLAALALLRRENGRLDEAVKIFQLLDAKGFQVPGLDDLAGQAAYEFSRYDLAEKWLTRAKAQGRLSRIGQEYLGRLPEEKKWWAEEEKLRQQETSRSKDDPKALPQVLLKTTKGDIVIELFEDQAPNTVANFIHLVEQGFYDRLSFHRVIPGFVAQGGDPNGDGTGGPGYTIPDEHHRKDARRHYWGSVAMAKTERPHSAGSQFYIALKRLPHLDGQHTVFGRVIRGMDVVLRLNPHNPQESRNQGPPDRILQARVIRKRNHPYVPKVLWPGQTTPVPLTAPKQVSPKTGDQKPSSEKPSRPQATQEKGSSAKPSSNQGSGKPSGSQKPAPKSQPNPKTNSRSPKKASASPSPKKP